VHRGDPVLGAVGGQPEDLQGAEVGGDERQPGDPAGSERPDRKKSIGIVTSARSAIVG
jgi:hypothetical protein